MSDLYSQAGDQWIGMALQQRHLGTTEQALQAYDGAFKRFAETAHSVPLHQEMRKRAISLTLPLLLTRCRSPRRCARATLT